MSDSNSLVPKRNQLKVFCVKKKIDIRIALALTKEYRVILLEEFSKLDTNVNNVLLCENSVKKPAARNRQVT